jgi:PEP-CTERM motif
MKRLLFSSIVFTALAGGAQAGIALRTSDPAGTPLIMGAGTTSGTMFVNIAGDNPPSDVMSGWNITLTVVPDAGTHGTLVFQDPATGTASNPPNYIFGADGIGISATNGASTLSASDFLVGAGPGVAVPGTPGANLLQMDFLASSDASGLFGVYASEGAALNEWTDGNGNAQLFTNVPDGSGSVLIGEVLISPSVVVPEPSSLALLGSASAAITAWRWRRKRKLATSSS